MPWPVIFFVKCKRGIPWTTYREWGICGLMLRVKVCLSVSLNMGHGVLNIGFYARVQSTAGRDSALRRDRL